jgi:hypothetical protein
MIKMSYLDERKLLVMRDIETKFSKVDNLDLLEST